MRNKLFSRVVVKRAVHSNLYHHSVVYNGVDTLDVSWSNMKKKQDEMESGNSAIFILFYVLGSKFKHKYKKE